MPDDLTKLPEGVPIISAADSDDGENTQGGKELTPELLEELLRIAWTAAAEAEAEGLI